MYSREKQFRQENHKPKKSHRNTPSFSSSLLDEICRSIDDKPRKPEPKTPETARFSRPNLVEKWIDNDKSVFRRRPKCENAVFPDNTSTSSDEFLPNRPRPVRTGRKDSYLFEEYEEHERSRAAGNDDLMKSKSRAVRIYSNLKKMKQPISPGVRLTSFINSIFAGLNRKKNKRSKETGFIDNHKAAAPSTAKSTVKIIADRDNAVVPRGHTCVGDGRPPLPPNAFRSWRKCDVDKVRLTRDDDGDDEDVSSESSSDLFELDLKLDHLSLFGSRDRFCEELPVYETTYFDKNRRLIR